MQGSTSATTPRGTPSRRGRSPRFSSDSSSHTSLGHLSNNYPTDSTTVFASSLDIQVEGTAPIKDISEEPTGSKAPLPPISSETEKRAPRKSKTDALVALNNQGRASSAAPDDDDETATNLTAKYHNLPPITVSPTLDPSSVKTTTPRHEGHKPPMSRPFGLQDCPEYYPNSEQFKDPMEYIKSIAEEAKQYGICKIVPPSDWKMPFVTNTEAFRFKTRLQRLNSIEASSRAKLNFLEQLYQYHQQQGNPRVSVPTINHKPLDLWLLRKEVNKLGGYEAVTANRKWSDLGRVLGYRGIPGLSTQIKNSYARVILPYEQFCERTKVSPTMPPVAARDTAIKVEGDASVPSSPLTATSSPLSEPPEESDNKDASKSASRPRRSVRTGSTEHAHSKKSISLPIVPPPIFYDKKEVPKGMPEQSCEICHKANRGDKMLLCDECDCGFHMDCLDPPIATVPADNWFCYNCLSTTGGDFGFDEGEEHSLSTFQARDLEFRKLWFGTYFSDQDKNKHLPDYMCNEVGGVRYSEYDVEEEFWKLVQSPQKTVEIEYGADVHSTTYGSAMPTLETHPLDPYSQHPWNLNNIPILSESLLRYIKSEISGMTVPWTYVGMVFSTFCWHNEDHYTYSINYMHWGETKTWYGIPGDDAELFEAAIKGEAPDLFQAQPDLLFQLVTLMNPRRLIEAGVRVYGCNQRAGEFVITFPKAYHAGFNHGLNFNEAVNFAIPDWLPFGLACVERYREHRKLPVFSHDELLLTIAQHSTGIKTAIWLHDSIKEMTERELSERRKARLLGLPELVSEEDRPEDQYQCTICKAFCYLSHVMCRCDTKVACIDHIDLLCEKPHQPGHFTLRKRIDDDDLKKLLDKIVQSAGIPNQWNTKFSRILIESARPHLRSLRAVLAEGDRINYPLPSMPNLRKCVTRANDWVDFANSFLIRKQSRKRSRRSRARNDSVANNDDPGDRPDRSLEDLYSHLEEVRELGFDCPEIGSLQNLAQQVENIKEKASGLLMKNVGGDDEAEAEEAEDTFLAECKRLLLDGSSLNVILDELNEVEKIVERDTLVKELGEKLDDQDVVLALQEVRKLLSRARACGLAPDNRYLQLLEVRELEGDSWEQRAQELCQKAVKTIAELEEFADLEVTIPVDPNLQSQILLHLAKARDYEKQANAWQHPEPGATKPRLADVIRLVTRAENGYSIGAITTLKSTAEIASEFESKCEKVLRNQIEVGGENFIDTIRQWCDYAKDHLVMFSLPSFDKVEAQLTKHYAWARELPWHCAQHGTEHGLRVLNDVIECTKPEEDLPPNDEFLTCICNNPVTPPPHGGSSDAVQCDHCGARFHGDCAKNGGSCPFCDHHHWNGAIPKERSWHFCFLPALLARAPEITRNYAKEYKELEIIVHRVDRLSASIGHFLAFTSQPANQRPEYISHVRHYMRKLYKIQFAVSPNPEVSFGLDLAGLHRILAGRPLTNGTSISTSGSKRARRPKFTFVLDLDPDWSDATRCFCRGHSHFLLNSPVVICGHCKRRYHTNCVFYPASSSPQAYLCPLCSLQKNRNYAYSEVRVRLAESSLEPDIYVNIPEMITTFSKEMIYIKMPKPTKQTLFVDLVDFQPGSSDDSLSSNGSHLRSYSHTSSSHVQSRVTPPLTSNGNNTNQSTSIRGSQNLYVPPTTHIQPPPPPWSSNNWSRWGTVSTPAQPPSTNHRRPPDVLRSIPQPPLPQLHGPRKRKHEEIILQSPIDDQSRTPASSLPPAHKRRAVPSSGSVTPVSPPSRSLPPVSPPPHPNQSLSPSLRKLMADPTPDIPTSSPLAPYNIPPIRQNGNDGRSPTLPSVTSLMSGMPSV